MVRLPFFLSFLFSRSSQLQVKTLCVIFASTPTGFGSNYCEGVRAVKDALQMKKKITRVETFQLNSASLFLEKLVVFFVFAVLLSSDPDTTWIRTLRLVSSFSCGNLEYVQNFNFCCGFQSVKRPFNISLVTIQCF